MGRLYIKTENQNGKTVAASSFFSAPFKIVSPFYDGNRAEFMIMQASAGILDGDCNSLEFDADEKTKTLITTQSCTKIFKSESGAEQTVRINVGSDADFIYFPHCSIPFEGSNFSSKTTAKISENSRLAICEIISAGRIGMGECFKMKRFHSKTFVSIDDMPIFADNTFICPSAMPVKSVGFFEGYTHIGMMYAYGFDESIDAKVFTGFAAKTAAKRGRLIRIAANGADEISDTFKEILGL